MADEDTGELVADQPLEPASLETLIAESNGAEHNLSEELEVILDIPVTVSMEIGRTLITIHDLLRLNKGSVVELDRVAGDPLDIFVNQTLIARGEVVVVNDKFGLRITEIINTSDRIKQLRTGDKK